MKLTKDMILSDGSVDPAVSGNVSVFMLDHENASDALEALAGFDRESLEVYAAMTTRSAVFLTKTLADMVMQQLR